MVGFKECKKAPGLISRVLLLEGLIDLPLSKVCLLGREAARSAS